jgi:hypothetical protein
MPHKAGYGETESKPDQAKPDQAKPDQVKPDQTNQPTKLKEI